MGASAQHRRALALSQPAPLNLHTRSGFSPDARVAHTCRRGFGRSGFTRQISPVALPFCRNSCALCRFPGRRLGDHRLFLRRTAVEGDAGSSSLGRSAIPAGTAAACSAPNRPATPRSVAIPHRSAKLVPRVMHLPSGRLDEGPSAKGRFLPRRARTSTTSISCGFPCRIGSGQAPSPTHRTLAATCAPGEGLLRSARMNGSKRWQMPLHRKVARDAPSGPRTPRRAGSFPAHHS